MKTVIKNILLLTIVFVGLQSTELFSQEQKLPYYYRKALNIDSIVQNTASDVTFFPEVNIYPHKEYRTKREQRKYEKLVRNFIKVYPYATSISLQYRNIDDTLALFEHDKDRKMYLEEREQQIMDFYKPKLTKLTLSQSVLLVKLLDRESGSTAFEIVDELKGSVKAFFWQSFALMFGNNLKRSYDSKGDDSEIEYLVMKYKDGTL